MTDRVTHVFFCSDDGGMGYVRVATASLLASAEPETRLAVHLVCFGEISPKNRAQVESCLAAHRGAELLWHSADALYARDADAFSRAAGSWNRAIWGRFFMAEYLPDFSGNVLYLDTDVLVRDDVGKLTALDLGDAVLGAVAEDDQPGGEGRWYFNSGVLLVNLANFRAAGGLSALLDFVRQRKTALRHPDQDALNAVFKGRVRYLHPRWNHNDCWVTRQLRFSAKREFWNGNRPSEILEAIRRPGVVHFIGGQRKPFAPNHRPARRLYNRAMRAAGLRPPVPDSRAWFHEPFYFVCRLIAAFRLWQIRRHFDRLWAWSMS